jgi:2-polyprenyl-3-methyl-5-hydroxy-6-metoxy-1,4-benzoquinol methylase
MARAVWRDARRRPCRPDAGDGEPVVPYLEMTHAAAPRAESALARHDRMVLEEMLQAEAVRSTAGKPADFWQGLAGRFRPPADAGPDPAVEALAALVTVDDAVIDVGAGGGRLAIPLAGRCREVVAIEPSPAMRRVLADEAARRRVANVRLVAATWEEAAVEPAALVFAAHVTYGVRPIEPFLRKLDTLALRHAAIIVMRDPPQTPFAPFWRAVHGEERLRLPCRDEVVAALREIGVEPEVRSLGPPPPVSLGNREEALDLLRFRLLVGPDTPADRRMLAVLDRLTEERDGEVFFRGAPANEAFLLRWPPAGAAARAR